MNRATAIDNATELFDSGTFLSTVRRRVAYPTESQEAARAPELLAYLNVELMPCLTEMGFASRLLTNPANASLPLLLAERHENTDAPTILMYGHGDVVRGNAEKWRAGLAPWDLIAEGDKWYGRGTADNKGQHSVNLAALQSVLAARDGVLGFNVKILIEMGEEKGSPGLDAACALYKGALSADVLIASDGPRVTADRPTLFLGSRGIVTITLSLDLREGAHHSGNWGGLLRNPATTLSAAINSLVNGQGIIVAACLRPPAMAESIRTALQDISLGGAHGDPEINAEWGEPGLSASERVFGWNTFEVLAMSSGNVDNPVGAIPATAKAYCQLRYVVGTEIDGIDRKLRQHLDAHGFQSVTLEVTAGTPATRLDPENEWVQRVSDSLERTSGKKTAILPNLGGTIPNHVFAHTLGLPTIWVPHSYPACSQHAPNEHLLASVAREGLRMMAGLFWDIGDPSFHSA